MQGLVSHGTVSLWNLRCIPSCWHASADGISLSEVVSLPEYPVPSTGLYAPGTGSAKAIGRAKSRELRKTEARILEQCLELDL